jgi:tagatose-1,6-bisphosphate aldolase
MFIVSCAALALGVAAWSLAAPAASSAAASSGARVKSVNARDGLRQFTGVITALDQTTLTVEKRGKKPRTVVFTKHNEMKTTGDVGKNAHVTVYYRDDGGHAVAHRVVVRPERSRGSAGGS